MMLVPFLTYLTNEMEQDIQELLSFSSVTNWTKNLVGMLVEFHLYEFVDVANQFMEGTKY